MQKALRHTVIIDFSHYVQQKLLFLWFSTLEKYYAYLNHHCEPVPPHISILFVLDNAEGIETLSLLILVIMFIESCFFGDLSHVFLNRVLAPTVGAKDGTLTLRAVTLVHPKRFFGNKL